MRNPHFFPRIAVVLLGAALAARAHFPILIHDAGLTSTAGVVRVSFAVGHPFELEMEVAPRPEKLVCLDARGKATPLTTQLLPASFGTQASKGAWHVEFEPARGDSLLALDSAAVVDQDQNTVYREYVKVYLHRGPPEGWNRSSKQPLEIIPRTRPYGVLPGMVFTARLMRGDAPVADAEVYFERLNERPPEPSRLPPEPLRTFAVRTDREGGFSVSLPEAGWWILGAYVDDLGLVQNNGKPLRLEGFAGLWIHVDRP